MFIFYRKDILPSWRRQQLGFEYVWTKEKAGWGKAALFTKSSRADKSRQSNRYIECLSICNYITCNIINEDDDDDDVDGNDNKISLFTLDIVLAHKLVRSSFSRGVPNKM